MGHRRHHFPMSSCVPLIITSNEDVGYYESWWLLLGFFIGLIIGLIIAFLCLRLCISSWLKKKRQDEEQRIHYAKLQEKEQEEELKHRFGIGAVKKSIRKSLKMRLKGKKKSKSDGYDDNKVGEPTVLVALQMDDLDGVQAGEGVGSLVNAMVQTTEEAGENELLKLDVDTSMTLEEELRLQKIIALAELLRLYLNKLASANRITESSYEALVERIHNGAKNVRSKMQAEIADLQEEIQNDPELKKNPALMQHRLEELPSKQNAILNTLLLAEQTEVVARMAREGKLSEEEADAMLVALAADMAAWERALGEQQALQRARLAERLLRRQQLLSATQRGAVEAREDVEGQLAAKEQQLDWMQQQKDVSDKMRQDILDRYRDDVIRLHSAHEGNVTEQQRKLAERLQQQREQRLKDLSAKQLLKERDFLRRVDQVTETGDFVRAFGALIDQQAEEREATVKDLDEQEGQAIIGVREDLDRERAMQVNDLEDQFLDKLRGQTSLSSDDVDNLVAIHEREVRDWKRIKAMEKKMMRAKLEERLAERKFDQEAEEQRAKTEEKALRERQILTLKKTLKLQVEVSDETKDRIMKEHEQNVEALSNQLAVSRNRQQRQTDQRLAERRAKVAELRRQKAEAQLARGSKAAASVDSEFDAKIAGAERDVAATRTREVEAMRERLAQETAAALAAQEQQLGAVLARMQLGQARRQNLIAKQDQAIAELEQQLQKKFEETGNEIEDNEKLLGLGQVLQQHQNQMEHLANSLEGNRAQQETILAERLRRKRQKKEHAISTAINEEAVEEKDRLEQAGISRSGQLLMEAALDQKHRGAMNDLEKEMMVELNRDKEAMNREMEEELQKVLAEQQKNFLAQLASVAALDEADVKKVAENAAKESGVEGKQARRFVRDFRESFRRNNSNLDEESSTPPRQRVVSFPDEDSTYSDRLRRPRSAKNPSKPLRPILREELVEEDF